MALPKTETNLTIRHLTKVICAYCFGMICPKNLASYQLRPPHTLRVCKCQITFDYFFFANSRRKSIIFASIRPDIFLFGNDSERLNRFFLSKLQILEVIQQKNNLLVIQRRYNIQKGLVEHNEALCTQKLELYNL